ncbi:MAG TPA: glycosyltransferase family 4 protein [Gemmatimonadaceae bacterium]|jgi:glycosyltransferase involved in cell wall biosynthesis|nr:glycosyltransferase family 4 protein [Gemmatimonadaceae bacterium]
MDLGTGWRGGQRQILWMGEGLSRRGGRPIFALRPDAELASRARASGIEVVHVDPTISEIGPWTVLRLRRLIAREHVDILHPQSGHTIALAALAAAGTRARIVFARRTTFPVRGNIGTRLKYSRADRIISVSKAGIDALVTSGIDASKVDVIPSGIPLDELATPASRETLASFGVPEGAPLVVMVGALTDVKDPVTFVRAVAVAKRRVPRLQALLVGEGHLRGAVEAEVRALELGSSFHLTGFRDDHDSFIAAGDIAALSSTMEGTPGVLLDALALGRPIASTAAGGVPEIVEHGVSGLLSPVGDPDLLGGSIARLLLDGSLARRMSAAASERARDFSIDVTVDRTIAAYERTLCAATRR